MTTAGGFQLPSVKLSCIQYDSAVKKDHEGLDFSENYHLIASIDFYNVSCSASFFALVQYVSVHQPSVRLLKIKVGQSD